MDVEELLGQETIDNESKNNGKNTEQAKHKIDNPLSFSSLTD